MTRPFEVDVGYDPTGRVCVVALAGKLDPPACEVLEPELNARVAAGCRHFVLDLSGLRYVGSLGLRAFVALANRVRGEGAVAACGLTGGVREVFDMTKMGAVLRIYATRADAVDAVVSR
ncbi:STAS domain-containing protein [Urbifossiella limnaea]|uniref:Anti-sigma factor antagonist n=1 Tax=Urbifossiella limnaea TaxID=2528023 RepID=A0A517Y213_9BACT|nr:STAS domain-containing protein [Urbifossiella limnaea]QDU23801.1 Putative anti-sigma factor antagonist BtrV [Urbifossiella limnaea]